LRLNDPRGTAAFTLSPPAISLEGFPFAAIAKSSERNYALAKSIESAAGHLARRDASRLRHL
jgi:hypothetical protein